MKAPTLLFLLFYTMQVWGQSGILETYIQEGLEQNLSLQREQLLWDEQQLKVEEARGNYFPTVSFNATYLRALGGRTFEFPIGTLFNPIYSSLNDLSGNPSFPTDLENQVFPITPNDFYDIQFYVTQPIYNPAIYYGYKAQQELLSVQEAQIATRKADLRQQIAVSYFNYLKTYAVLDIYDSTKVQLQEVLRFNQALVKNDKATADIVATVEFELENLKSQRVETIKDQRVAQAFFNTLLHRELDTEIEIDESYSRFSDEEAPLSPMIDQALSTRTEPEQLQRAIKANQVLTELERKSMLPTLGLSLSGGYQAEGLDLNSDNLIGTGALSLNWTLFEGQKRKKRIAQAQKRVEQLDSELEILKEQIQLQVIQAWNQDRSARQKVEADRAALRSAEKSFNIIEKRYRNEQALLVEYLDARTRFINARVALVLSAYDVHIRQAELKRAIAL
ncbi:MAG: TolC family protein [Bacteroidota bacterium]